jgi:hypothetical protein
LSAEGSLAIQRSKVLALSGGTRYLTSITLAGEKVAHKTQREFDSFLTAIHGPCIVICNASNCLPQETGSEA